MALNRPESSLRSQLVITRGLPNAYNYRRRNTKRGVIIHGDNRFCELSSVLYTIDIIPYHNEGI